ncbi:unnamed protein product [Sphagnum jensenii]|uniref:Uncharacterized protein n=1 Tax=Sphagnum jensenii TaxID=128206 RepID=A0ABP0XGL6_9BRYO
MLPLVWCYFPSSSNHQPPQKTTAAPLHTQNGQLNKTNSPAFVHEGFCRMGGFKLISSHEFHSFATCYLQKVVSPEEETLAICVELEEERQELFVL